jgi:hypothetical protein
MAHDNERADLFAEISLLQKQQLKSFEAATFFGWTPEAKADHDKRADRMDLLCSRLAELDGTP